MSSHPDVEWDDTEREWFLALDQLRRREESERCHLCGLPKDVCRAIELDGNVPVEFERCHVSAAIRRKQKALSQGDQPAEYLDTLDFKAKIPLGHLVPKPAEQGVEPVYER